MLIPNTTKISSTFFVKGTCCGVVTETGKLNTKSKQESLPPTKLALELNIKRVHFSKNTMEAELQEEPPPLDPGKVKSILIY